MIKVHNSTYDVDAAIDYFKILKNSFEHYHWYFVKHHNDPRGIGDNLILDATHGYGLQTIYNDLTFPYHMDIDPHDEGPEYFKDTELVFGFFKDVKAQFSNVYRSFLLTIPPGNGIPKWSGGNTLHSKIIIPIETNDSQWLHYYSDTVDKVSPELGKIYQIDMVKIYAGLINNGDTDISFIVFNIPG